MKRLFDITGSLFGLILLSPLLFFVSVWIKIDSRGTVFFRQSRVGRNNIDFKILKFRTMVADSDKHGLITVGGRDNRITRVGYFIRRHKIDEIPQLINVLTGDMSFVGPRPEVRKYVDLYSPDQRKILQVRPGITDYASIYYRNENELLANAVDPEKMYIEQILPQKINYNMIYINNYTSKQYFKIIFLTLWKIFK